MQDALVWVYVANAVLLIVHEIDSAYWREWNLFKSLSGKSASPPDDKAGITAFLIFHIPAVFLVLYGLLEVQEASRIGLFFSILWGISGVGAFAIHMMFLKRGREEFKTAMSVIVLTALLITSACLLVIAGALLVQ